MTEPALRWTPLSALAPRLTANLAALADRDPALADRLRAIAPAAAYAVAAAGDTVHLGVRTAGGTAALPCSVTPAVAAHTTAALFPPGQPFAPVLVAGEQMGWLWDRLYRHPCLVAEVPGHRLPLYLAMADLERLWALLHLHDWRQLLADPRVRLFAGPDAVDQFRHALATDWACPWPLRAVTLDPTFWPAGASLDTVRAEADATRGAALAALSVPAGPATAAAIRARHAAGQPLRVLGLTSRFTTFLQHSMRDWLAALDRLGHATELLIERADHELLNSAVFARAAAEFRPDLIVMIDHHRGNTAGLPSHVPVAMWVQDRLPHIYAPAAGAGQGPLDYALGYGRQELSRSFGYPAQRFMPAMVGVNETRFSADPLPPDLLAAHRCDVSFVTHATAPAERIVADVLNRTADPDARRVIDDLFQQLRAVYDAGNSVDSGNLLQRMIERTLAHRGYAGDVTALLDLFQHRVNNALFRHQTVRWVAELGVDLHLYGRGWEDHPDFARHARGEADNEHHLRAVYQASAINLQATPFGAVHQRLLDGLAAGGFFLLRSTTADAEEGLRRQMWRWAQRVGATDGREMLARSDDELAGLRRRYAELGAVDLGTDPDFVYAALRECAATGFTRTHNTLWADSDRVAFATGDGLQAKVRHFLAHADERREVACAMRQRVLETHTYTAISRDLLTMIAADLRARPATLAA